MNKILSILTATVLALGLVIIPAYAEGNNTKVNGTKETQNADQIVQSALQSNLKKAQDQLSKVVQAQGKLNDTIQKAIDKAKQGSTDKKSNTDKQISNINSQLTKWEQDLTNAAEHDKQEQATLNAEITKWTNAIKQQQDSLNKQLTDIDVNLTKQLAELEKRLAAAKDDSAKQIITTTKANVQNYVSQKKSAINKYSTTLQVIFTDRQNLWKQRQDILTRRQAADAELKISMNSIKKTESNDKLAVLTQSQATPVSDIEATVKAKYQKSIDELNTKASNLKKLILDIQTKLNK